MKKKEIIRRALPILEKLEQDYIDGKITEPDRGGVSGRHGPTNVEKLTEVSRLIHHSRLAIKEET